MNIKKKQYTLPHIRMSMCVVGFDYSSVEVTRVSCAKVCINRCRLHYFILKFHFSYKVTVKEHYPWSFGSLWPFFLVLGVSFVAMLVFGVSKQSNNENQILVCANSILSA